MSPPPTDKLAYWNCAGSIIARRADGRHFAMRVSEAEMLREFFTAQVAEQTDPAVKAFCRQSARDLDEALQAARPWNVAFACAA